MTRKHYSFGTLAIVGLLLLLGTFGPWMHRVATERLSTYRMCLESRLGNSRRVGPDPCRVTVRWAAGEARPAEPARPDVYESLMSAVPSYRPPVVSRNWTLSCPGSVALKVKEKNGFSATLWVVSKIATVLPR